MTDTVYAVEIHPWQIALYDAMRIPASLKATKRLIKSTARDLETARTCEDQAIVENVTTSLRLAIIELTTIDAASSGEYAKKAALLRRWRDVWAGSPLAEPLVVASLQADAARLGCAVERVSTSRSETVQKR